MQKSCFVVEYSTKKDGMKKRGIAVGDDIGDVDVIINEKGKVEKKIWDYRYDVAYGITVFRFPYVVLRPKKK